MNLIVQLTEQHCKNCKYNCVEKGYCMKPFYGIKGLSQKKKLFCFSKEKGTDKYWEKY